MGHTYPTPYLRPSDNSILGPQAEVADRPDRPFALLASHSIPQAAMSEMMDMDTDEHISKKQRLDVGTRSQSTAESNPWEPVHHAADITEDTRSEIDRTEVEGNSSLSNLVLLLGEQRATQLPSISTALTSSHPAPVDGPDANNTYPTGINTTANTTASLQMAPSIRKRAQRAKASTTCKYPKADTAIPSDDKQC